MSEYYREGSHGYMQYPDDLLAEYTFKIILPYIYGIQGPAIELGAGLGRFSGPLLRRYSGVTLVEPSPAFAAALRKRFSGEGKVTVTEQTAHQALSDTNTKFSILFGFHLLHHLSSESRQEIHRRVIEHHATAVFVEPNPFNPLYPLQIGANPDMSFWEERRSFYLTPRRHRSEVEALGGSVIHQQYGVRIPPQILYPLLRRFSSQRVFQIEKLAPWASFSYSYQFLIYRGNEYPSSS
jgi:hypothetical protein